VLVLFAVSPLSVSAATTDPVLRWIDVMNTTVLGAGTPECSQSRSESAISVYVLE
jgi:hypothetical protein